MERATKGKRWKRSVTGVISVALLSFGATGVANAAGPSKRHESKTTVTVTGAKSGRPHITMGIRW